MTMLTFNGFISPSIQVYNCGLLFFKKSYHVVRVYHGISFRDYGLAVTYDAYEYGIIF